MIIPMILFEGIVLSFIVLVACVVGIANGPVGLVCLYEREVWNRCIENGLTTEAKIKKSANSFCCPALCLWNKWCENFLGRIYSDDDRSRY